MEKPYEQIRRMVKLFEYNRLKLRFRNEDERARFIDGWAERFCEADDAEWNIAVTIMTARRREPNFYNMEKALREAQGIRRDRRLQEEQREQNEWREKQGGEEQGQKEGREENSTGEVKTGLRTAVQTNSRAATANIQKRALQLQGSYNLKTTPPKTPEEIAQEALLRYERRGRL